MNPELKKSITAKRARLIHSARTAGRDGSLEKKADAEMRLRFLMSMQDRLQAEVEAVERPKIFISFSVGKGTPYYERAETRVGQFGFDVYNGFKRTQDANVLKAVRTAIAEAATFLVIMTPELQIHAEFGSEPSFAPSVWVVEEKGMALALGKPFRMLVHSSVHRDFWHRTTPGSLHHVFDERTFDAHLDDALGALQQRYEELQLAGLGMTRDWEG